MTTVPHDPPSNCPGTESIVAGKSKACEGCPNQIICSTASKEPDPDIALIKEKLKNVKRKILILSGKGGVGKSTFCSQLSWALAENEDYQVGLMDIDICGPSIPKILGIEDEPVHQSGSGWIPIYPKDNLAVMSVGLLLKNQDLPVIWRGPKKNGIIKQFLKDVDWGDLDCLLFDTPPGTSDEHLSIVQFLKDAGIDGAILITTPQEIALQDVRKELDFCKKVDLKVIGIVENMSRFVCPNCKVVSEIFKPTFGGAIKMASDFRVPFLGSIPLDPIIGRCCDEGLSIFEEHPDSETIKIFKRIVQGLNLYT